MTVSERLGPFKFMIGKIAVPDHPVTVLNPNGREGFVITEATRDRDGKFAFRGADTMWFGEDCVLRFRDPTQGQR